MASMIEIVQDVISTDVAGPLLNGVWGLLETLFQRQAGFGDGDTVGRAFYLDAILGGEVEGVLGKVALIPVVVQQPTKTGRESDLRTRC